MRAVSAVAAGIPAHLLDFEDAVVCVAGGLPLDEHIEAQAAKAAGAGAEALGDVLHVVVAGNLLRAERAPARMVKPNESVTDARSATE